MLGFVIDEVVQDPAQVVFGRFAATLETDDPFQVFIVVRKKHVARLIPNLLDLFQAKLRGVTLARHGYTTEFCLNEIDLIRNQTRDVLFSYNDKDLERVITYERNGETTEYNLRWILHHLIDHEAQHKGQILMLKRLMAI